MARENLFTEYTGTCAPMSLSDKELKYTYSIRRDVITGNVCHISRERAEGVRKAGVSARIEVEPEQDCRFCHYEERTPTDPALPHNGRLNHRSGAVTVRNLYPYGHVQYVTLLPPFHRDGRPHKLLLSELGFGDLEAMMETEFDIAELLYNMHKKGDGILTFRDFTNWGPSAGASMQHPHFQRTVAMHTLPPAICKELMIAREYFLRTGRNLFDDYMELEREAGSRVIHDDNVFISAAFAPKYDGEVIVIPKQPFSHILQTTPAQRNAIIDPSLGVFPAYLYYWGRGDVNIAVHMAPFEDIESASRCYRWHMHICPRKKPSPTAREAGSEIFFEDFVIGEFPEDVAERMRHWYRPKGPDPSLVVPELRARFDREILGVR